MRTNGVLRVGLCYLLGSECLRVTRYADLHVVYLYDNS